MMDMTTTCEHGTARVRCMECIANSTRQPVEVAYFMDWCAYAGAKTRHVGKNGTVVCLHCEELREEPPKTSSPDAMTDKEPFDLTQIPFEALKKLGAVFREGEVKYGKGNWKNGGGNREYQLERANHALKHLYTYVHWLATGEYVGEAGEEGMDLAKVAWFCVTQMELERLEKKKVSL